MRMTKKDPKKESARTAPTTGKTQRHPLTILEIKVASILLMLYSLIKYTIKFESHPPVANVMQAKVPENHRQTKINITKTIYIYSSLTI